MQKVYILKDYKEYKKGETRIINENEAHSLIDGGYAVLFAFKNYKDKMMRTKSKRK